MQTIRTLTLATCLALGLSVAHAGGSVSVGDIKVDGNDAFDFVRRAASQEGLFVGISSGASLSAINQKLYEIPKGARILTFNYDTGERYLSVEGLF